MKKLKFVLSLIVASTSMFYFTACCDHEQIYPNDPCETPELATVKDLTGLDGCGLVLEMVKDQTIIESVGTDLKAKGFKEGDIVTVGLHAVKTPSICMVGQTAEILCIDKLIAKTK